MLKTFFAILAFLVVLTGAGDLIIWGQNPTLVYAQDTIYNMLIGGAGDLIKNGTDRAVFTRNNPFTGHAIINEGILALRGYGKPAGHVKRRL